MTTYILSQKFVLLRSPQINLRVVWILGVFFIGFLLISYVFQINQLTKTSFYVSNYEQNIAGLLRENKDLEVNFSQANSLASLEALLRNSNYVEANKIHYIQILQGEMAVK